MWRLGGNPHGMILMRKFKRLAIVYGLKKMPSDVHDFPTFTQAFCRHTGQRWISPGSANAWRSAKTRSQNC